jgi:hypothetical protein
MERPATPLHALLLIMQLLLQLHQNLLLHGEGQRTVARQGV